MSGGNPDENPTSQPNATTSFASYTPTMQEEAVPEILPSTTTTTTTTTTTSSTINNNAAALTMTNLPPPPQPPKPSSSSSIGTSTTMLNVLDLAQWVPLRLSADERILLTVLEQTLHVSEYTDNVDVTMYNGGGGGGGNYYRKYNGSSSHTSVSSMSSMKTRRILDGILEVCHIATGLATASGQGKRFADLCYPAGVPNHESSTASKTKPMSFSISSFLSSKKMKKKEKKEKKLKKKLLRQAKRNKYQQNDTDMMHVSNHKQDQNTAMTDMDTSEHHSEQQSTGATASAVSAAKTVSLNTDSSHRNSASTHMDKYHIPWASREPHENAILFQTMFEIGRRNKVLNPSSMRSTYGKLMYLLQDAQNPIVAKALGFSLHKDIVLVGTYLEQNKCIDLLHDPRLECAIQYISDRDVVTGAKYDRDTLDALIQGKQHVMNELITKYSYPASNLANDDVKRVIESLADAVVYIESNVRPVQIMLQYLKRNFHPDQPLNGYSLSLRQGSRGAVSTPMSSSSSLYARYGLSAYGSSGNSEGPTLSHNHVEQYTFVEQSLKLWCKVMRHMHRLWVCADDDLLSTTNTYHLYNTGQGLNRVQACPRVRKVMSTLLHQTQHETGKPWVGLSVIHLGDRDVPNALIFIDKYTQIPRFLNPIVNFLVSLPSMMNDKRIADYTSEQFGTIENLRMIVLQDYFRHGFDGSGDDGGSCIDGRLTSSWNWTSRLAKKSYYHTFMLSGFQGFDGDFR